MLLREALRVGIRNLIAHEIPSPQLAAELLLMHVLDCDRGALHTGAQQALEPEVEERYFRLIAERATGKPTQYITGHQEFWGLNFEVTPDVLIPRPETEHLVEAVLEIARAERVPGRGSSIVDVGTGSGCIALALASELPQAEIDAVDLSAPALRVARRNAARLGLSERVRFWEADLLTVFISDTAPGSSPADVPAKTNTPQAENSPHRFDFVVSNPPYVGLSETNLVQREVREFEPRLAWGGFEESTDIYRRLFSQALIVLGPGGYVVVEIGYLQKDAVTGLLGKGWEGVEVRPDLASIPRVVIARRN